MTIRISHNMHAIYNINNYDSEVTIHTTIDTFLYTL